MLCHEFEIAYEQADSGLSPGTSAHLEQCANCRAMVADLELIRSSARELAVVPQEPPESVWVGLRAQLVSEGVIRQPELVSQSHETWRDHLFGFLRQPVLAGAYAAVALVAVSLLWFGSSAVQPHAPAVQSASVDASAASAAPDISSRLQTVEAATLRQLHPDKSAADASLKRSIAVVDNFIAMCEKTVRQNPRDEAAREYLFGAYQQKSELLATVIDHSWQGE
jgi:hypothetical protein